MSDERERRRTLELAGVALVSLLGMAAAVAFLRKPAQRLPEPPAAETLPPPEAPEGLAVEAAARPAEEDDRELSYGRLMTLLGAESEEPAVAPVAKAFVEEFKKAPELVKVREEFAAAQARGEKPSAAAYLQALREQPRFRKLVGRLGGSAAGRAAVLALVRNPELKRFLRGDGEQQGLLASNPGGRAPAGRAPAGRASAVSRSASPSKRGVLAAAAGPSAYSAASAVAPAGGPPVFAGPAAAASTGGSYTGPASGGSRPAPASASPGSSGGALTALGKIEDASSELMKRLLEQYPWLSHLGEDNVLRLIKESRIDEWGTWGACFSLGIYGRCVEACNRGNAEKPGACRVKDGWGSCLDWKGADRPCIAECRRQAPCQVPADRWQAYCVARRGADGSALPSPPPYPECSAAGEGGPTNAPPTPRCEGDGEGCTAAGIRCWSQGIGLPDCVGQQFCGDHGYLPRSLPELVDWGNRTGRRNPADKVWTCR